MTAKKLGCRYNDLPFMWGETFFKGAKPNAIDGESLVGLHYILPKGKLHLMYRIVRNKTGKTIVPNSEGPTGLLLGGGYGQHAVAIADEPTVPGRRDWAVVDLDLKDPILPDDLFYASIQ